MDIEEKKKPQPPKKPVLFYYGIILLVLVLLNFLVVPYVAERSIKEADYNEFLDDLEANTPAQITAATAATAHTALIIFQIKVPDNNVPPDTFSDTPATVFTESGSAKNLWIV